MRESITQEQADWILERIKNEFTKLISYKNIFIDAYFMDDLEKILSKCINAIPKEGLTIKSHDCGRSLCINIFKYEEVECRDFCAELTIGGLPPEIKCPATIRLQIEELQQLAGNINRAIKHLDNEIQTKE